MKKKIIHKGYATESVYSFPTLTACGVRTDDSVLEWNKVTCLKCKRIKDKYK